MNIEEKIKKQCELNNITVKLLAQKIGMSETNIYKCFKRNSMESKYLIKIAEQFNITIGQLLDFDNVIINKNKAIENISITEVKSRAKVLIEIDLNDDEVLRLGIKEKVLQILNK